MNAQFRVLMLNEGAHKYFRCVLHFSYWETNNRVIVNEVTTRIQEMVAFNVFALGSSLDKMLFSLDGRVNGCEQVLHFMHSAMILYLNMKHALWFKIVFRFESIVLMCFHFGEL